MLLVEKLISSRSNQQKPLNSHHLVDDMLRQDMNMFAYLLEHCNFDLNESPHKGRNLLFYAAASQNIEMIKAIVDLYKQKEMPLNIKDEDGMNILYGAIKPSLFLSPNQIQKHHGDMKADMVEIVRFLLNAGVEFSLTNNSGNTPLHMAAEEGKKEITDLLLSKNAALFHQDTKKFDVPNNEGFTPTHLAILSGNAELIDNMLIYCNPDALYYSKQDVDSIKHKFFENGNVMPEYWNEMYDESLKAPTALILAIKQRNAQLVDSLVECYNFDLTKKNVVTITINNGGGIFQSPMLLSPLELALVLGVRSNELFTSLRVDNAEEMMNPDNEVNIFKQLNITGDVVLHHKILRPLPTHEEPVSVDLAGNYNDLEFDTEI